MSRRLGGCLLAGPDIYRQPDVDHLLIRITIRCWSFCIEFRNIYIYIIRLSAELQNGKYVTCKHPKVL